MTKKPDRKTLQSGFFHWERPINGLIPAFGWEKHFCHNCENLLPYILDARLDTPLSPQSWTRREGNGKMEYG